MSKKLKRKIKKTARKKPLPAEYARLLQQAEAFKVAGNAKATENSYLQAIQTSPDRAQAYLKLAQLYKNQGRNGEAVSCFSRALAVKPNQPEINNELGLLYHFQGSFDQAAGAFKKAIGQRPGYWVALHNLSNTLQEMGDMEGALASCRLALELKPDVADLHFNKARLLQHLGLEEEWIASCRKALELDPGFAMAHLLLSRGIKHREFDLDMAAMAELYFSDQSSAEQKMHLGFALGKAYEDLADFGKAFEFYEAGNRLKRQGYKYRLQADAEYFAGIRRAFSPGFLADLPGSSKGEKTPIFIVGMPRSGTSLAEQILASHPMVFGGGEMWILEHLVHHLYRPGNSSEILSRRPELRAAYLERAAKISGVREAPFFTDKMPHNFIHIGMIRMLVPEAKIIHCCRNPMDTCLSIYKNLFATGQLYAYDQRELGGYYQLYAEMMDYWHKELPGFVYDISYEKLVAEPESQIRSLLAFCGLPWHAGCLDFHQTKRSVSTLSVSQVRKPIYQDSVQLWKQYGDKLNELKEALGPLA